MKYNTQTTTTTTTTMMTKKKIVACAFVIENEFLVREAEARQVEKKMKRGLEIN
jgi:hypothetical protein